MLLSASGATNSDSAIVGLQAMHLASGTESLSPFLWGSHYQTSADSLLAALAFRLFGASPLVLMASSLAGHVALVLLIYATLARFVPPSRAAVLASLVVISGAPVNGYALFPPRQLALTLSFLAFYLFARAQTSALLPALAFFGALVTTLAVGADPYSLIFVPSLVLFAFCSVRRSLRTVLSKPAFVAATVGAFLGAIPYVSIATSAGASHGMPVSWNLPSDLL